MNITFKSWYLHRGLSDYHAYLQSRHPSIFFHFSSAVIRNRAIINIYKKRFADSWPFLYILYHHRSVENNINKHRFLVYLGTIWSIELTINLSLSFNVTQLPVWTNFVEHFKTCEVVSFIVVFSFLSCISHIPFSWISRRFRAHFPGCRLFRSLLF